MAVLAVGLFPLPARAQNLLEDFEVPLTLPIGGDFTLEGGDGRDIRISDFRGRVILLSFGYTHCPDACPMTLSKFVQVKNILKEISAKMQAVLITLDPERDTGELLDTYVGHFDPAFIGMRGTSEAIAKVAKQFLARYRIRKVDSEVGYLVDHTTFTYLIDQAGHTRYLFNLDTPPAVIAEGVKRLLAKASI